MKKILLLSALVINSSGLYAKPTCSELSNIADNNYVELDTLELQKLIIPKGQREFFHSAPSAQCKLNKVFIIPDDVVTAYYTFQNENKTWLYVVYTSKNGEKTAGWVTKNNFRFLGTTALDD
ncbi:hypothetical protein [Acinetobacter haemolyticus]|uniref:hypothetical protein n=1 Tax=Acinetobacter haemolyticus TaxID=29430 RepID=UPI0002CEB01E|nr:hypothetical protein [Acinetobacter haemolyticus]ENW20972.1 hypothetical protein F926_01747 [Acinetobacter haemolyticus NIPH 261]